MRGKLFVGKQSRVSMMSRSVEGSAYRSGKNNLIFDRGVESRLLATKEEMNTEIIIHPKLQHCGLTTGSLDRMLEWYGKVLGMTVNKRVEAPAGSPFKTVAFVSNDEVNHRLSFFETPGLSVDAERVNHARVQHIAFEYKTLDNLLGTYVRLKQLGIPLLWAADQFIQTAVYYEDPDGNILELNVNNFTDDWTVRSS